MFLFKQFRCCQRSCRFPWRTVCLMQTAPWALSPQVPSHTWEGRAFLLSENVSLLCVFFLTGTYLGGGISEIQVDPRITLESRVLTYQLMGWSQMASVVFTFIMSHRRRFTNMMPQHCLSAVSAKTLLSSVKRSQRVPWFGSSIG